MLDSTSALTGPGATGWPERTRCNPFGDYLVAQLEPVDNGGNCRGGLPELYAALLGFVVGSHREDVISLLIGQHRGARDRQYLDRLHALQHNGDEFAVGSVRAPDRSWWRDHAASDWG